jgi:hypothetical protein
LVEAPNVVRITRHNDVLPVPGNNYNGRVDYVICSRKTTKFSTGTRQRVIEWHHFDFDGPKKAR